MNGPPNSSYGTDFSTPVRERSAANVAIDNLIRRSLRVSDPSNAHEVALALQNVYPADREAMKREAAGLPFVPLPTPVTLPSEPSSSNGEIEQARTDVERDLNSLCTNALLKDIEPELKGWGYAIRNAIADGVSAARFALDSRQRERTFGARRLLGDYARLARYVGALTPTMNLPYRRLAQSLDEVAAIMLVLMGEALANSGFSGGRFLLQAPASELQERRDAVLYALRNLIGSTQQAYGPNEWPRGLVAYQQFIGRLETAGQADLKALFQEPYLARLMDDLIDRASSTSADGLRALGSTAQLGVESFRRLITTGQRVVTPESPALAAFLSALQLFVDPFDDKNFSRGSRLLFISRPPIVFYGLYGVAGPDEGTDRLITLVSRRGRLAELLDCYLSCQCTDDRVRCQIMLDKILYDVDRAIDLYALGTDPDGDGAPERRASAYGYIIHQLLASADEYCCFNRSDSCSGRLESPRSESRSVEASLKRELGRIRDELWYREDFPPVTKVEDIFGNKFTIVLQNPIGLPYVDLGENVQTYNQAIEAIEAGKDTPVVIGSSFSPGDQVVLPNDITDQRARVEVMQQELCVQLDSEGQWENLLQTMAPSCVRFDSAGGAAGSRGLLEPTRELLTDALRLLGSGTCRPPGVSIPPHFETSLDSIADDVSRTGAGRPTTI